MKVLCLGGSYTARNLHDYFGSHHDIRFISRNGAELARSGYAICSSLDEIKNGSYELILDAIPAIFSSKEKFEAPYRLECETLLRANPRACYVHISSTSVYPKGSMAAPSSFDETCMPDPDSRSGEKRLYLEERLQEIYPGLRIVRSGGIYGRGRAMILRMQSGKTSRSIDENRFISRIHVTDLVRICIAFACNCSIDKNGKIGKHIEYASREPRIVNAVDTLPSSNSETFAFIEKELGRKIPGKWRTEPVAGRMIRSLYASDFLGGEYIFPSFREGFRDALFAAL